MSTSVPEVRLSELEAELTAKRFELSALKNRISRSQELKTRLEREITLKNSECTQELERRIKDLERQNDQLRPLESMQSENERLRVELDHILSLRHAFESKFKETKVQLLRLQHSPISLASLTQENLSLRSELQALQSERSGNSVRSLEKELATLKLAYDRLYQENREEAVAAADVEEEGKREEVGSGEGRRRGRTDVGPWEVGKEGGKTERSMSGTASYCPSFLRQKKPVQLPPKRPSSRYLRLDLQKETFEGIDPS